MRLRFAGSSTAHRRAEAGVHGGQSSKPARAMQKIRVRWAAMLAILISTLALAAPPAFTDEFNASFSKCDPAFTACITFFADISRAPNGAQSGFVSAQYNFFPSNGFLFIQCSGPIDANVAQISINAGNGVASIIATLDLSNPQCAGSTSGQETGFTIRLTGTPDGTNHTSQIGVQTVSGTQPNKSNFQSDCYSELFNGTVTPSVGTEAIPGSGCSTHFINR